jgi:hypothetical protein
MAVEGSVSIGGASFPIYGLEADANTYFKAHADAAAWAAADSNTKRQAHVTAARSFDRQGWVGTPTDLVTPQGLAWPRIGVTDRNGQAVPDAVIPQDIAEGAWEWALAIVKDPTVTGATPGTNTKRTRTSEQVDVIKVESELELFRPTIGHTARFPTAVQELVGWALDGGTAVGVYTSGTGVTSSFTTEATDFGFDSTGLDGGANS